MNIQNIDWNAMILGGVIGFVISVLLSTVLKISWKRLIPQALRNRFSLLYRKAESNKPYLQDIKITDAMERVIDYSMSRIAIIRLGDLYLNDHEYKKRMEHIVKIDHIWDWHVFTKKTIGAQSEKWLTDFYKYENGKYSVDTSNSTTNLLCVSRNTFLSDETITELFLQYNIDPNFDDLIIYGVLTNVETYPTLREAITSHLAKFDFKGITIFTNDGQKNYSIDFLKKEFINKLLISLINMDKYKYELFVDKGFTQDQIKNAEALVKHILE